MSKYYKVSDEFIDKFKDIYNKKSFPFSIKFEFIGNESQKTLIKIKKISDDYSFLMEKDLILSVNEDLTSVFDDESITILIEQEIDKVSVDIQSGKIKMIKPDLNTFTSLITKYGVKKVARANQVEELYQEQKKDGTEEFII